jgi:glycosyltransferase involved in cell wall biosynthesis
MANYLIDQLSVFFPAYNEEKNIKNTVEKAIKVLNKVAQVWEIIIVNDGSKDKTGVIADELAKADNRIRVIHHSPNRGYGAALKSGFYNSKYPWIVFTDSDGQFNFSQLPNFINKQKETGADLVVGYYIKRAVPFYRKLNTFLWQVVVRVLFNLKVRDIDCGFKLISKSVIDSIPKLESERGAFISSEFLIKAQKSGFKIVEIGAKHYRATRPGTGSKLNVIIKSFIDLFKLWKKLR